MKTPKNLIKLQIARFKAGEYGAGASVELRKAHRNIRDVFTPCVVRSSLLKTSHQTAKNSVSGDVILFSPACSNFDQFQDKQGMGKVSRSAAKGLAPTMGGRIFSKHPNIQAVVKERQSETDGNENIFRFASGFFEEKPRRKKTQPKKTSP